MAISDYSTTAASNTSLSGIDISGTTGKVKDGDNAIRQLMADIKAGVPYLSSSQFLFESTDAGAAAAPVLNLYRNSASPAASDILGNITFNGEDSAGNTQEYASIETVIVDATSTSDDGQLDFYVTKAGSRTKFASMTATATAFTGAAGYTFDAVVKPASNDGAALGVASTGEWSDLFLASGAVFNFANGNWVATHSSGILTVGTGDLRVTTAGTNASSVVTVGGTQTLANKTLTTPEIGAATGTSLVLSAQASASRFTTTRQSIADDGVYSQALPNGATEIMLLIVSATSPSAGHPNGLYWLRGSTAPAAVAVSTSTNIAVTTGVLSGTTGTDGNTTLSVNSNTFYLENRTGASKNYTLVFLG